MTAVREMFAGLLILLMLCSMIVLLRNAILHYAADHPGTIPDQEALDSFREGAYLTDDRMEYLLTDAVYFPVPESRICPEATVSYENSWMFERTFGGKRGHEGCDLMGDLDQRGYYPVVSISSGVVEKIGWLRQGGNRIGIRSPGGCYFYYAHLYSYADGLEEGNSVSAGELIGYMGDSGYSDTVGTVGHFSVHLHLGIYIDDENGEEMSLNPYPLLKKLENHKLKYIY